MTQIPSAYATALAPRYTSYPTAPHFTAKVSGEDYLAWLRRTGPAAPVSLYLHVPFCRQVCWYCACNMKLANREAPLADYARTLIKEIDLIADALPDRRMVSHIHFGGGTPTALAPDDLAVIMERLRDRFDILPDAEIAIEGDPRTLTDEMAEMIGAQGFTRASFGVQEFDPTVQKAINRIQPPEMVASAVERLRDAGVSAFNFDLIYGLPHQTEASIRQTVALAAEMRPDRAAIFGYAHVPWMAKRQRMIDEAALPGADARLRMAAAAAEAFAAHGYEPVGIDHFALPDDDLAIAARNGTLRRNFQGYTTDAAETLIPLGATSIGRTPEGYVQNIAETGAWSRAVEAGEAPIAKGLAFSGEDRLRGEVIEGLMCAGEADLAALGRRHGRGEHWWADAHADIARYEADGLLKLDRSKIVLSGAGKQLARVVASAFDEYMKRNAARHSVAV